MKKFCVPAIKYVADKCQCLPTKALRASRFRVWHPFQTIFLAVVWQSSGLSGQFFLHYCILRETCLLNFIEIGQAVSIDRYIRLDRQTEIKSRLALRANDTVQHAMITDLSCCGFSRKLTTHMVSSWPLHWQHTASQSCVLPWRQFTRWKTNRHLSRIDTSKQYVVEVCTGWAVPGN